MLLVITYWINAADRGGGGKYWAWSGIMQDAKGPPSIGRPPGSTSPTVRRAVRLLNRVHHVEDRQVHGDHHAADDDAQHDDHDRLHERQQGADGRVHLVVVEVGDLGEHFVEAA